MAVRDVRGAGPLVALALGAVLVAALVAGGSLPGRLGIALTSSSLDTSQDSERRGQQALSSLEYPWRDIGYTIEFRDYTGGQLGTANSRTKRIVIYVKRGQSHQSLRVTISHELGHALDFQHATVRRHDDYRVIRRLPRSGAWYPCSGCSDYRSHAGDWAEVFAYWLAGPGDFRSQVAGPPSEEQLRRLRPLFAVPRPQASATPTPSPTRSPSPSPSASPSGSPLPVSGNAVPDPLLPAGRPSVAVSCPAAPSSAPAVQRAVPDVPVAVGSVRCSVARLGAVAGSWQGGPRT